MPRRLAWLFGLANDFTGLYIAAGFAGFFGAIGWPAQLAMTADLLGPQKRANGFGIQRVVINSTFALGPLAGGFFGPRMGYLPLFIMDALTSYFVALVVFSKLPETRPNQEPDTPGEISLRHWQAMDESCRTGRFCPLS